MTKIAAKATTKPALNASCTAIQNAPAKRPVPDRVATENTTLKFALAGVATLLLGGVAIIVSANTQTPVSSVTGIIDRNIEQHVQENQLPAHSNTAHSSVPIDYPNYYRHILGLSRATEQSANAVGSQPATEPNNVNVNTFLLAARLSNDSRLAELQMQPTFAEFNSTVFIANQQSEQNPVSTDRTISSFRGVGFPHIETSDRAAALTYKPYKQLVSISENQNGDIVPHIKCMGLSPERVAKRAAQYDGKIIELALKHNVSASLVKAVVAKESCFNAKARSHVGAIGLMQLMPETAKWLKVSKPTNVDQNLAAGVRYLAQLRKRFGSNELALAAYNAGPGNVERYNGIPPFAETQNYVKDVMHFYRGYVATTRFVNALNDYQ